VGRNLLGGIFKNDTGRSMVEVLSDSEPIITHGKTEPALNKIWPVFARLAINHHPPSSVNPR